MTDDGFLEFVLDQLSRLSDVTHRRMFGAHGLYEAGEFFAIVDEGRLYFKIDEESRRAYEEKGMKAFAPKPDMVLTSYYEVPVDVLEDDGELCEWARRAVAVHKASTKSKPKKKAKTKAKRRKS
jgi:DNA transformation protein